MESRCTLVESKLVLVIPLTNTMQKNWLPRTLSLGQKKDLQLPSLSLRILAVETQLQVGRKPKKPSAEGPVEQS